MKIKANLQLFETNTNPNTGTEMVFKDHGANITVKVSCPNGVVLPTIPVISYLEVETLLSKPQPKPTEQVLFENLHHALSTFNYCEDQAHKVYDPSNLRSLQETLESCRNSLKARLDEYIDHRINKALNDRGQTLTVGR